jgi:hypothetical protein
MLYTKLCPNVNITKKYQPLETLLLFEVKRTKLRDKAKQSNSRGVWAGIYMTSYSEIDRC